MISRRKLVFLLMAVTTSDLVGTTKPMLGAEAGRVVVVQNENSPISKSIAADYMRRRDVHNIVSVTCPDSALDPLSETIDFAVYQRQIEKPLRTFLSTHTGIDFIVLTKGVPIRLRDAVQGDGVEWYSLDSHLAALDYEKIPDAVRVDIEDPAYRPLWIVSFHRTFKAQAWANRYWNSTQRFSHVKFGGYLVTRLDGYTEADAEALTTRSLQATQAADAKKKPGGEILLNIAPKIGFTDKAKQPYSILSEGQALDGSVKITSEKAHLGDFNSDMQLAAEILKTRGIPVELEQSGRFMGNRADLMGYFSWGSNDPAYDPAAYHSLRFDPGALCDTAVSSGGRTFLPTEGGQSLIVDLIAQGITGIKGYADEPLVQAVAFPSIVFDRYTRGWTLAESLYAGSALVGWEDLVIGDPLARAYPTMK
jgi:uncharacterized protein (TIGR03790 family)